MILDFVINILLRVDDGEFGPKIWPFYLLSHSGCKHTVDASHTH